MREFRLRVERGIGRVIACDAAVCDDLELGVEANRSRLDCRYELSIRLRAPRRLHRRVRVGREERDFDGSDRRVFAMLRPHLAGARAAAQMRESVAAAAAAAGGALCVVLVDGSERVEAITRTSASAPGHVHGDELRPGSLLPRALRVRLASAGAERPDRLVLAGRSHPEGAVITVVPREGAGWAVVFEAPPEQLDAAELLACGVTAREVEVLELMPTAGPTTSSGSSSASARAPCRSTSSASTPSSA